MVEIPNKDYPCYVCAWSRNVHWCGEKCTRAHQLEDNSGMVCPLTGRVLPRKIYAHYITRSKEDPRKRKGDHLVKMAGGRSGRRRRTNSISGNEPKMLTVIKDTVRNIMMGTDRDRILKETMARYIKEVQMAFRSEFSDGVVDYTRGMQIVHDIKNRYNRSLNRPAENMDETTIHTIAKAIAAYYLKIKSVCKDLGDTSTSLEIFTACIIDKLASGFVIQGVTIIPRIFFFSRHAPEEIQFGSIGNIKCLSMSRCNRQIQSACITKGGYVLLGFKFSLRL